MNELPHATQPMRVMVVDDDPLFRKLIVTWLRERYIVQAATDGAEAYHLALQQPPDVVVLDLHMPNWDGYTLLSAFRSHVRMWNVPVLILTSDHTRDAIMESMCAGADDYIFKSKLTRELLLERVAEFEQARRRRQLQEAARERTAHSSLAGLHTDSSDVAQQMQDSWE